MINTLKFCLTTSLYCQFMLRISNHLAKYTKWLKWWWLWNRMHPNKLNCSQSALTILNTVLEINNFFSHMIDFAQFIWLICSLLFSLSGDRAKINKLVQMAWTFSNDRLTYRLQYFHFTELKTCKLASIVCGHFVNKFTLNLHDYKPFFSDWSNFTPTVVNKKSDNTSIKIIIIII